MMKMPDYGPMPKIRSATPQITRVRDFDKEVESLWMREQRVGSRILHKAGKIASGQAIAVGMAGGITDRTMLEDIGIKAELDARVEVMRLMDEWWATARDSEGFMRSITLEGMKPILRYQQLIGQRAIKAMKAKDSI